MTLCLTPSVIFAQVSNSSKLLKQLKELHIQEKYEDIVSLTNEALKKVTLTTQKDSLHRSKLLQYQLLGLHKTTDIDYIPAVKKVIQSCPQSASGDSLKAVLYNDKAYHEDQYISAAKGYRSILKSIKLLENLPNPNPGYLMGGYLLLSNTEAYYGNFDQAKYYMRLAEETYSKNKKYIDNSTWELNGNNHRMGVIAKYRKIYMYYKLAQNAEDSLVLINTMKSLEEMHNQPNFHKEERIYYSTALNHVGDWFVSHENVSLGLTYLHKALNYVENKKYNGTPWAIKYNIAKGYIRGNQLDKADSTMAILFKGISPKDGRLPFFLAQKALIKVKKQQKDSAKFFFHQSIEKVHNGEDPLKKDYSNFAPTKYYNRTRLLLRIHEELERYYAKDSDSVLQKMILQLPFMALQQFENSYLNTNFNSVQNEQLRKIIQGILKSRKTGAIQLSQDSILNKFEVFKNQLSWKKFYENRYTNALPELDSIKRRQQELASILSKAKVEGNIVAEDSISNLLNQHQLHKKELFPRLELLSDFQFSVKQLQQELTSDELILKYVLLDDEIAIYLISAEDLHIETFPWKVDQEQLLIDFIEQTRNRNYDAKTATQLGNMVLPRIDKSVKSLIINPDGILFKVPFEILQNDGRFLAENYNIRYTSNLGFVRYNQQAASPSDNIHIYAPRYKDLGTSEVRDTPTFLKGANQEAKQISELFPSTLFDDEYLNKSTFISTSGDAKMLHLAMHAEVNSSFSEFSRMLFSDDLDNEEDHLYLEELYGLSLSADLAILSACNTGTGQEKNGNLESFQRAFTFAGVPATVASLWEVPDGSTKEIMISFYQNLKEGQTKSEALRNAKLTYRERYANTQLAAPYFWAGFVVYGSDTPVIESSTPHLIYALTGLIPLLILLSYRKKKRRIDKTLAG